MTFESILQAIVDGCGGGLGIALMGNDGIAIAQAAGPGGAASWGPDDVSAAGVEFGRILEDIRKASDALDSGGVSETVISTKRQVLVLRPVDEDTFLVLALSPDGNLGKARYLVRRHLSVLRDLL